MKLAFRSTVGYSVNSQAIVTKFIDQYCMTHWAQDVVVTLNQRH